MELGAGVYTLAKPLLVNKNSMTMRGRGKQNVTVIRPGGSWVGPTVMVAPPNYGTDYAARFNAIYPDLAKSFGVPLYRFFLEGVAADARFNQADGLHPTAEGVDLVVKNILPTVEAFLGKLSGQRS